MPEPVKLDLDETTRVVVEHRDGRLVALVQRRWNDGWADFGEATGGDGTFHIRPAFDHDGLAAEVSLLEAQGATDEFLAPMRAELERRRNA